MSNSDRRPPRRMQQRQYQQQHRQQYQQQYQQQQPQSQPPAAAAPASLPGVPRDLGELKQLLQQYGPLLSAENRSFIQELIAKLEGGGDVSGLMELAGRMQQAAGRQQAAQQDRE